MAFRQKNTTKSGLGYAHQKLRRMKLELLQSGIDTCFHCMRPMYSWQTLELDHIIPRSSGGPTTFGNTRLAHKNCNRKAGRILGTILGNKSPKRKRPEKRNLSGKAIKGRALPRWLSLAIHQAILQRSRKQTSLDKWLENSRENYRKTSWRIDQEFLIKFREVLPILTFSAFSRNSFLILSATLREMSRWISLVRDN